MIEETTVICPHCWENVSLVVDLSEPSQDYVEDCPVCCQPMRIILTAEDGSLVGIEADRADG